LLAVSSHQVLLAHESETPHAKQVMADIERWCRGEGGRHWLWTHGVGWVIWGPDERRKFGEPPLRSAPDYRRGAYAIWRVPPTALAASRL
jgi:hypothetical protein